MQKWIRLSAVFFVLAVSARSAVLAEQLGTNPSPQATVVTVPITWQLVTYTVRSYIVLISRKRHQVR